ncbi:MAG: cyclopropane-fatty-acyl-phospholipid synthase family protein [Acidobacteriota bacterium]
MLKQKTLAEKLLLKTLEGLRHGRLELIAPSGRYVFGDPDSDLSTTLVVENPRFFSRAVFGGDDGAGDSYVDGDWWSHDLVSLVRIIVKNLGGPRPPGARWVSAASRAVFRLQHRLRANTMAGSRRNIAAHYDLSNDFFRLFLDREMLYSCALYKSSDDSLEQAQMNKLDHICQKLDLQPGDHVLEIGTGWGAFAERAVTRYGCRVTTTTISQQQHDAARQRFDAMGRSGDRIELLLQDYRTLTGQYDKLVSIEMFEAVGLDNYDAYFVACDRLLKPEGVMLLQTITMNEQRFPEYHRKSDWIQRRIFPGGELASISEILLSLGRTTSLTLTHSEDIGIHYALTLAEWRKRFHKARESVLSLNFDERFLRMWDYYLAYCEGAFRERYVGDSQLLLAKIHSSKSIFGDPATADVIAGYARSAAR